MIEDQLRCTAKHLVVFLACHLRHVLPLHLSWVMCHEAFSCLSRGDLLHNVSDEFVHRPLHLLVKDLAAHFTAISQGGAGRSEGFSTRTQSSRALVGALNSHSSNMDSDRPMRFAHRFMCSTCTGPENRREPTAFVPAMCFAGAYPGFARAPAECLSTFSQHRWSFWQRLSLASCSSTCR